MMVNRPEREDVTIEQQANWIEMVAKRMSSPSRMEGRNVQEEMEQIIRSAEEIIRAARAIQIANPIK